MLRIKNKLGYKKKRIIDYTFVSSNNLETTVNIQNPPNKIDSIEDGNLRKGYLAIKGKKSNQIPTKRVKRLITGYLKWVDQEVGIIYNHVEIKITNPKLNSVVEIITKGKKKWGKQAYIDFLADRVISKGRRDIESLIFRLGLIEYDVIKIAEKTHAINPRDLFWISHDDKLTFIEAVNGEIENIFSQKIEKTGGSINSANGHNIKSYTIDKGKYGIRKKRISNLHTDAESEVAVYKLGKLLGIDVCPAWFIDKDTVFSMFKYNLTEEYLVHARWFFKDNEMIESLYHKLIKKFPDLKSDIQKMCLLDFITRQEDRHLSNIGILMTHAGHRLYPLYDNGRSLFYGEPKEIVEEAVNDIIGYSTTFGKVETYYDVVREIANTDNVAELINLNVSEEEIREVLKESGFKDYRLEGNLKWMLGCLKVLEEFGK